MGLERVAAVVKALQQAGIPADRGFPAKKMPYLPQSVAAVHLEQMQGNAEIVAVWIYTPMRLGGAACEETALQAGAAVAGMGGKYQASNCQFDAQMGLFAIKMVATFG